MQSRTSPLRKALAGLCGPVACAGHESPVDVLAAAGLQLRVYAPPADFGDQVLERVVRQAVGLGLLLTDEDGNLVGRLQAVPTEALDGDQTNRTALAS